MKRKDVMAPSTIRHCVARTMLRLRRAIRHAGTGDQSIALSNTFVEHLDWKTCVDPYDRTRTLFFLDPPYWKTEGSGVPFPYEEFVAMAARLRSLKGKAITSLNDHLAIRQAFEDFHIETIDIKVHSGRWRQGDVSQGSDYF